MVNILSRYLKFLNGVHGVISLNASKQNVDHEIDSLHIYFTVADLTYFK